MKIKIQLLLCLYVLISALPVQATNISYTLTDLGGNRFEYEYRVENDSLAFAIEEFTIFFDLGLYENLAVSSSPADWDSIVIEPDPLLPDDGFFDALALSSGILPGDTQDGFSVSFDWLGVGAPTDGQYFEVIDPTSFAVLDQGTTILATSPSPVPEPSTLLLFTGGLLLMNLYF